eukprot:gene17104-8621_t
MDDLPEDRVTPDKPPFSFVGIDCFGPYLVKRGRCLVKRRGRPEQIKCDNGPNFRSGEGELRTAIQQWNQNRVHKCLLQKHIKWIFNPPTASHMGSVWERAIRSVRRVLIAIFAF